MAMVCEPDPTVAWVAALSTDYERGLMPGWPDDYAAPIAEGVRLLMRESRACESELMEAR